MQLPAWNVTAHLVVETKANDDHRKFNRLLFNDPPRRFSDIERGRARLDRPIKKPTLREQRRLYDWCPRPESNRHALRRGIFFPLRLSPPARWRCSWSGARLHHSLAAVGARRLLSTPSREPFDSGLGSALARTLRSRAFAEFDGLHLRSFLRRAQIV